VKKYKSERVLEKAKDYAEFAEDTEVAEKRNPRPR
jgi:hypothetical protein